MVQVEVQYLLQERFVSRVVVPFPPHVLVRGDLETHMIFHPTYRTLLPLMRVVVPFHLQVQYLQNEVTVVPHLKYTMPIHQQPVEGLHSADGI